MKDAPLFLGLMSGTSCDAIDAAIVRIGARPELIHFGEHPMPAGLREPVLRLAVPGINEVDTMGRLHRALGLAFAEAALRTIAEAGLQARDIAAIGSHGQTIRHRPKGRHPFTLQIGCASTIAEKTGITTIADFRSRDIAAGGQGAPLAPFAHRLLFGDGKRNIAVLNIGGIANVTWLGARGDTLGFDTGPGNMLMDGLMLALSDGRDAYDGNGELAASGQVDEQLLARLMQHPFIHRSPPKSTGREDFGDDMRNLILGWPGISDADRLATAAAFTVQCVREATRFLPEAPERWLVCGGGAANAHLMRLLTEALAPAEVTTTTAAGWPSDAIEAVCFALLARQTLLGAANTIAEVTGAARAVCGGLIAPGDNWPKLLAEVPGWIR